MGKFIAYLMALGLIGYGVWYLFLREVEPTGVNNAVEAELNQQEQPAETKSMLPSGEAPRSVYGRAYNHSATTATQANEKNNAELEAQMNSM